MGRIWLLRGTRPETWRVFFSAGFIAVLALLALAAPSEAGPVRFFAVGNKQRLDDAVSYESYRNKMAALMDRNFPNRSDYVQAGVDDVASHLRWPPPPSTPRDPNAPETALVVFPEDVGLINAFIGSRGAAARQQSASAPAAIASLAATYQPQVDYYEQKFPGQPPVRTLMMALTDTLYRSFYETFRDLADQYDVYLSATMNAAPACRIEQSDDPARVALLRDPDEPTRTYAYEAVSPRVTNTTFVFHPDGHVIGDATPDDLDTRCPNFSVDDVIEGSVNKAYLTPIEQPPPGETASLHLAFGAIRDMSVINTPAGKLGIVISKDAWMPDVNDRFAAKGANVMVQPEAFSAWAYESSPWQPDIFKEGGFATLQKIPSFLHNINSSMTGNFFDVTFDGQSSIHSRKTKTDPGPLSGGNAWVGQNPDTGFLSVAPWIVPDPGIANPSLSLAARRSALAAEGAKLLPGSGVACPDSLAVGACENGYREAVVWTDVNLPSGAADAPVDPVRQDPRRFGRSVRVNASESTPIAQRTPQVAAFGSRVYVVWHEKRTPPHQGSDPRDTVYMAVSRNRGASFGVPIQVADGLNPSVATDGNQVVVAWQTINTSCCGDRGAILLTRFDPDGNKLFNLNWRIDEGAAGKWLPQAALVNGKAVVAWIDERDLGPEGEPLEHVYAARESPFGFDFLEPVRVDSGAPVPLASHLDNKWSPAVAVGGNGELYAAWTDFRNYNWDIFAARSDDAESLSFGQNVQVNDLSDTEERIDERPTLAVDGRGVLHAAWTDLRSREPDTNIFYAQSEDGGATFSPNRQLDDSKQGFDFDRDTPTNQWHPSMAAARDTLYVAWQDNRLGNNDIFFTSSLNGGDRFRPSERVDDTGAGVSEQTGPRLAWARGYCYVVWEDNRSGASDIYLARRRCPVN